ncbi:MAG TPA: hypothetical protein VGW78_06255 [Candidatus Babeliales bacterium]|jgi:hypothetical protein|nr:hypothetical protein [Candidatus Babeliales bacterium]
MKHARIVFLICIGSINAIQCMNTEGKRMRVYTSDAVYTCALRNYIIHGLPVPITLMKKLGPNHYQCVYQHNQKIDMHYDRKTNN